jgi:hypothetical protein
VAKSPPLFVPPQRGYHRLSATTEGFDAKDSVGAGDVRRDWGSLLVRLCRVGDHSGAGAQLLPGGKSRLRRTRPALPMGTDLGLRARRLLVCSLRRPLLVPPVALLASSALQSRVVELKDC